MRKILLLGKRKIYKWGANDTVFLLAVVCMTKLTFSINTFIHTLIASTVIFSTAIAQYSLSRNTNDLTLLLVYPFFFLNWDSLHVRLNSHYEAWSMVV